MTTTTNKNTFCVIDKTTLFPYCGKCNSDLYYSNIDSALISTSKVKNGNSPEYICWECWIKILEQE